jgi:hypothetical protein
MSTPEQSEEKGHCTTCLEPIRIGAKKCIKCDSYQDWRRFLTFSSTVLALLVSLVAVTGALVPAVMEEVRRSDSDVQLSNPVSDNGHVYFLATNYGKKPGIAEVATVVLDFKDGPRYIWLHLVRSASNAELLPADDTKELDYTTQFPAEGKQELDDAALSPAEGEGRGWNPLNMNYHDLMAQIKELDQRTCTIKVKVKSFKGKDSESAHSFPCQKFHVALEDYWAHAQELHSRPLDVSAGTGTQREDQH